MRTEIQRTLFSQLIMYNYDPSCQVLILQRGLALDSHDNLSGMRRSDTELTEPIRHQLL